MSRKFNNRTLLIIFGILILLFVFVKFYRSVKTESTLNTSLVNIDTAKVTQVLIYPTSEKRQEIKFFKEGKTWKVSSGKVTADAEAGAIENIFGQLLEIKPKSLAAKSKEKWADFMVTDTTATRVKVYEGGKEKLNLLIGRFSYQKSNSYSMYGGGVSGTTYVRLSGEDEVYAIEGFLSLAFNQPFNSWRNQTVARFDRNNVTKLIFEYPGDSSFTANLQNNQWLINGQNVDSSKFVDYLGSLGSKNSTFFDDNFIPSGNPVCQLTIQGNKMTPIIIKAWSKGDNQMEINSSANPKSWFVDNSKSLFRDIFKNKTSFFKQEKKKK